MSEDRKLEPKDADAIEAAARFADSMAKSVWRMVQPMDQTTRIAFWGAFIGYFVGAMVGDIGHDHADIVMKSLRCLAQETPTDDA